MSALIAQILSATGSDGLRNAAALALVDLHADDQSDALISAIRRSELAKCCGTLLFALDELGASLPLGALVNLIENGSYEAKAEALIFAQNGRLTFPENPTLRGTLIQRLQELVLAPDPEVAEAAALASQHVAA